MLFPCHARGARVSAHEAPPESSSFDSSPSSLRSIHVLSRSEWRLPPATRRSLYRIRVLKTTVVFRQIQEISWYLRRIRVLPEMIKSCYGLLVRVDHVDSGTVPVTPLETGKGRMIKPVYSYKSHVTSPFQVIGHGLAVHWDTVRVTSTIFKSQHLRTFLASSGGPRPPNENLYTLPSTLPPAPSVGLRVRGCGLRVEG